MFYWFTFTDGYMVCIRGFSTQKRKVEKRKRGNIVSKVKA